MKSYTVDNLAQGVSQQTPEMRRGSQCEAQFDCINSPKDGCVSRNGFEVIAFHISQNLPYGFFYEIFRGSNEHYLAVIASTSWAVYNLDTGALCSQADIDGTDYRTLPIGWLDRDVWRALTLDDFTYVANQKIPPGMTLSDFAPARPKEAMLFFKAGSYLCRYTVSVDFAGLNYKWTYTTPDNSVESNAALIDTGNIAATFYRAMSGFDGEVSPGSSTGVGGTYSGDLGGAGFGTPTTLDDTLGTLPAGFNFELKGNLVRLWRDDGQDFTVDMTDGAGNQNTEAFKDTCRSYTDLPKTGFEGFTLKIRGLKSSAADDYYVRYTTISSSDGFWQETVGPGVPTTLDAATMPHAIVNTGLNSFEWRKLSWSTRIAGDLETAKTPRFVGRPIEDLFYHKNRLGILTEAAAEWSKSRNPYTHFPDSVQTILATDRVSYDLGTGGAIALCRKAVEVDEALYAWAQGVQFRVSNANTDSFKQDTVEAPASTFYEFAEKANFGRIGSTLYFATEPGEFASIRNLVFQNSKPAGDLDVTAHIPDYIPVGVRSISTSDTQRCIAIRTDGAPRNLYLYNYLLQDKQYAQSAWNTWRLPGDTILWSSIYRDYVYVALQRGDGLLLLKSSLKSGHKDPDGGAYHTRLDLRVDESSITMTYDALVDETTLSLPFALTEDVSLIRVVVRVTSGEIIRGQHFEVLRKDPSDRDIVVKGDCSGLQVYVGLRISSERHESEFYVRTEKGLVDTDTITLDRFRVRHNQTGYYRLEASVTPGRTFVKEMGVGSAGLSVSILDQPPTLNRGYLDLPIGAYSHQTSVKLINDSVFPSRWQSASYRYKAVIKATPDGA